MSSDKTLPQRKRSSLPPCSNLDFKTFSSYLQQNQRKRLNKIQHDPAKDLRKTVYLSSGGSFFKYIDFMRSFTYQMGYVPIHPIGTLDYYVSMLCHENKKVEVIKDCFSLLMGCDELWVFNENSPTFDHDKINEKNHISHFPEGVLAEIYFWLLQKPRHPLRFFTWEEIGIPKYADGEDWSLFGSRKRAREELQITGKFNYPAVFGILDLGSSTVKLFVCRLEEDGSLETLFKKSIYTNLVENFFETKVLGDLPMERTIQAITELLEETDSYGIVDLKLVGTGALRQGKNARDFIEAVKNRTGLDLEILSSEDEADLVYEAVSGSFPKLEVPLAVLNVGGSSTRLILSDGRRARRIHISLPLGVTDLNERFYVKEVISEKDYKDLVSHIKGLLEQAGIEVPKKPPVLVHSGGELDYMIITGFPLKESNYSLRHPKELGLEELSAHAEKMRKLTKDELRGYMPNNPKWMDGAVVSNAICETVAKKIGAEVIIPSNMNVNDGIVLSMIEGRF